MKALRARLRNNKGMSLVELLIVVVITMIIMAMLLISYSVVTNANVSKSARRLESVIRSARVAAMSQGREAGKLTLQMEGGNLYALIGDPANPSSKDQICNGSVTVSAIPDYTYLLPVGDSSGFASGSETIVFNTAGTLKTTGNGGVGCTTANRFKLRNGRKSFTVTIFQETGGVEVVETTM